MNAGLPPDHPSVHYYDGDYPWRDDPRHPENFDDTTAFQGIAHDVSRYLEIARETGGPLLELCCGTGRIAVPLARRGFAVTAVDLSQGMLDRFASNLEREPADVGGRITLVRADVTELSLDRTSFPAAILGFNSLLCIADFAAQRRALGAVARHLAPGGLLALDIVNPLELNLKGDALPKPFFTRRNPSTGNTYTRFAASSPLDPGQRQKLFGWYDEIAAGGVVRRQRYSLWWRPIFRYEAELMLEQAGFRVERLEGGHRHEPVAAHSAHLFFLARKV